jgi:hypothetical protein
MAVLMPNHRASAVRTALVALTLMWVMAGAGAAPNWTASR